MSLFERLPLDLKRLIALYLKFSYSFPLSQKLASINKYHNILGLFNDEMIWKLIFGRDFGFNFKLTKIIDFKREYIEVFNKNTDEKIEYAMKYSLEKLEIDAHFFHVAWNLDIEKVKYWLGRGANVNIQNSGYYSPIHKASSTGNISMLIYLISCGADINIQDLNGASPLHRASFYSIEAMKYLIEKGANINIQDLSGATPLLKAVDTNDIISTEYLVKNGANIDSEDTSGRTPLFCAIANNNIKIVKCLVENGANCNLRNKNGEISLNHAAIRDRMEMIKYLVKKGADYNVLKPEQKRRYKFLT